MGRVVPPRPKATPRITGETASLELERPLATGLSPTRPFAAHFHAPEGMVLLREPPGLIGFFAGSLGSLFMEDVFSYVLSGIRSGQLIVQHGAMRRTVSFRDGQVVFASSSERYERLGAALVQLGLITSEQLTRAVGLVTATRRIGQVLTTEGMVSEANLYNAMTFLVREVVLNLFEMMEGSFIFMEAPPPLGDIVKLPERTKDLVIQGIKRGEATNRLRRQFPDDMRVVAGFRAASRPERRRWPPRCRRACPLKDLRTVYRRQRPRLLHLGGGARARRLAHRRAAGEASQAAPSPRRRCWPRRCSAPRSATTCCSRWCTAPCRRWGGT